jgi:uncharacterized protein YdgA (DUF945 family)
MNKPAIAVGTALILGAGYLGATAWIGQQTELRYREQVAQAQGRLPFVTLGEQTYKKGFFTSTSSTSLQFGCPSAAGEPPPTATITSVIRHGPIAGGRLAAAAIDSQLHIDARSADAQRLVAAFGAAGPISSHTIVAFDGSATSVVSSPAAELSLGDAASLKWQGLSGELDSNRDGTSVRYRFKGPGLSFAEPAKQVSLRIGAFDLEGDGQAIRPGGSLMAGQVHGTLDAVELAAAEAGQVYKVALNGLALTSSTSLEGDLLGGTSSFVGTGSFGETRLDKIDMKMSMKRLHAPTYQHLMDTFSKELYRCGTPGKAPDLAAIEEKTRADVLALLVYGPEMSLDRFAVESGGRTGELSYAFGVAALSEAEAKQPLSLVLMKHVHARAASRLPVAWLRQLSQAGSARLPGSVPGPEALDVLLDRAAAEGYVVREGEYVKGELSIVDGTVSVNGKPLGPK